MVVWYIAPKTYWIILAAALNVNELDDILRIEDPELFVIAVRSLKTPDETTKSPLLVAAKYGCHKILKSILDLNEQMQYEPYNINLNDFNAHGENILHLGITITNYYFNKKSYQNWLICISLSIIQIHSRLLIFSSKTSTTVCKNRSGRKEFIGQKFEKRSERLHHKIL